jgi:phosphatidylserine decarboxylase
MTIQPEAVDLKRSAGWLPGQDDLESWIEGHGERVKAKGEQLVLHPVIKELQELIDTNPVVRMYLNQMIEQVPSIKPYRKRHLESVEQMLRMINELLTMAPEFGESSMVATPLNAILDWSMGTPAGFGAFRDPRINAMLKKILCAWCEFLNSPDSLYVLNDSPAGWKSVEAQRKVGMAQYEHDPQDEHWGFASWNDFFTRRFKEGERPVASSEDDKVIVSACESTPYGISTDVKRQDRFWIKSQPYSLEDMLANDDSVISSSAGPSIRPFSAPSTTTGGTARWPARSSRVRSGGHLLLGGGLGGQGRGRAYELTVLPGARRGPGDHRHRRRRPGHRPDGLRGGRYVGGLLLHDRLEGHARVSHREG